MSTITFDFRHHYQRGERRESEQIAYQWDLGHVMEVFVPEDATYTIGYCFGDYEKTEDYAIDTKVQDPDGGYKLTAHIPNKYFERSRELRVYVVGSADDHIITTYEGFITIRGRLQPDDYVDDDPENGATQIIEAAREYATKSESFAVGGTGTRLGEDTDNAKYYLEQAEEVAESIPEDYSELSDDVDQLKNALTQLGTELEPTGLVSKTYNYTAASGYEYVPITISAGKYKVTCQNSGVDILFYDSGKNAISGIYIPKTANNYNLTITAAQASNIAYLLMYQGSVTIIPSENIIDRFVTDESNIAEIAGAFYSDNKTINKYISSCKINLHNNTIKTVKINIPQDVTTYVYIKTYDSSSQQVSSDLFEISRHYDSSTGLFLVHNSNYTFRMIADLGFMSGNHAAYDITFQALAYEYNELFDYNDYPFDKHIDKATFSEISSGKTLSNLMNCREAIKEVYVNSKTINKIEVLNGLTIRLKNGSTQIGEKTVTSGYVGPVLFDDYCGIYFDSTAYPSGKTLTLTVARTTAEDNPLMSSKHTFFCGANRQLTTLKAGIEAAMQYMDSTLYVDAGVYDLITEFGADYFANLGDESTYAGLKIGNRIHIIFSGNSVVLCHYDGDNENVCRYFSPFNFYRYGYTLENLTLFSSRTRYGVHDGGGSDQAITKFINCHIEQDNSQNEYWSSECAIASGLGPNQEMEVTRCVFGGQVYWHLTSDTSNPNHKCVIRCVDSYFLNNTLAVQTNRNDATYDTEFAFAGNSLMRTTGASEDGIIHDTTGATHVVIRAWNNEIRESS